MYVSANKQINSRINVNKFTAGQHGHKQKLNFAFN